MRKYKYTKKTITIAGKEIQLGSYVGRIEEGASPEKIIKILKEASQKKIFPDLLHPAL